VKRLDGTTQKEHLYRSNKLFYHALTYNFGHGSDYAIGPSRVSCSQ
jgi:hypothetical protein